MKPESSDNKIHENFEVRSSFNEENIRRKRAKKHSIPN